MQTPSPRVWFRPALAVVGLCVAGLSLPSVWAQPYGPGSRLPSPGGIGGIPGGIGGMPRPGVPGGIGGVPGGIGGVPGGIGGVPGGIGGMPGGMGGMPGGIGGMPGGPRFETIKEWRCSKCNHLLGTGDVPPSVTRCTACGVRLSGVRDVDGNSMPSTPSPLFGGSSSSSGPSTPMFVANPVWLFGASLANSLASAAPHGLAGSWSWVLGLGLSGLVAVGVPGLATTVLILNRRS